MSEPFRFNIEPMVVTFDDWQKEPKCERCGNKTDGEIHACPFRVDINNDEETQCNCCKDCEKQCWMDR